MNNVFISIIALIALPVMAGYTLYAEFTRARLLLFAALTLTALIELFDLLALSVPALSLFWKLCALYAESLLPLLWLLCTFTFARQSGPWKIGFLAKIALVSTLLFPVVAILKHQNAFFYAPDFPGEGILFLNDTGVLFYIALAAFLVVALVNLEVTLTNASPDAVWKIKLEIIGLGTILTVQLFYYSQALLYRTLNMGYLSLRSFLYLVAVALMSYSFVFRRGKVTIQVSRQAAFKSFVLFAVALYLVLLGLLGEGMKYFGSYFPRSVTISLAFLMGIALLILLMSDTFRREVKVALHKNFYQHKHDYRTQWLRFTEQLSTSRSGEELVHHILSAYCDIFVASGASLFLYEKNRGGFSVKSEFNMKLPDHLIAPNNSLIAFMVVSGWVVCVAEENSEIAEEDLVFFRDNHINMVVPLFYSENLEGFIVLGRPRSSKEVYIYEDFDLMKTIARQASLAILHQRLSEHLTSTREIEAIGNVATFVAHDLKNLVSNLSLIVENAPRYIHNPDFQQDMLLSLGNTVVKMQKLIGRLKNLGERDHINMQPVNLLELAEKTVHQVLDSRITVSGTAEIVRMDENEIQKVIMNLLVNGIEASPPHEPLFVEVGRSTAPFIRITDRGCGMSAGFVRSELFKPFKTTKQQGLGIGLYQCSQIIEAHAGKIEVNSVLGEGSVFTIWFADEEAPSAEAA